MDGSEISRLKTLACHAIDSAREELEVISQEIWKNPELYYEEHQAHKLLTDYLSRKGFKTEKSYKLETAYRASHGTAEDGRPNIAVLCEYDALPEIGHACGHNLIAEVGIAAALGIKAAMEAAKSPLGQLTVLGTPAEEGGGGKIDLIKAGCFTDIDAAMMAHPGKENVISSTYLAMLEVYVTYRGKASHAAGFPWEGVNALDAAVMAYQSISCLRQQIKPTWRVHGIITKGGAKPNIIPEEAQVHFYLRAPTKGELDSLTEKAKACFDGAAQATGCSVEYEWDQKPYYNVLSNKTMCDLYRVNCENQGVKFSTDPAVLQKHSGSTDMGNVSHQVPAIHPLFHIGTKESAHSNPFREAAGSPTAQPYSIQQGKALAMTALDIYTTPGILNHMKQDFILDKERDANMSC